MADAGYRAGRHLKALSVLPSEWAGENPQEQSWEGSLELFLLADWSAPAPSNALDVHVGDGSRAWQAKGAPALACHT